MKPCTKCGEDKPFIEYYKDSKVKDGHYNECKSCIKKRTAQWKRDNPEQAKNTHLKSLYGISSEEYNTLLEKQSGVCAICLTPFKSTRSTHLDHCHTSKKIRGILCANCNRGIGMLKESLQTLENAIHYLKTHS